MADLPPSPTFFPLDLNIPSSLLQPLNGFYQDEEFETQLENSLYAPMTPFLPFPEYAHDPANLLPSPLPPTHTSSEAEAEAEEEYIHVQAEEAALSLFGDGDTPIELPPAVTARSFVAKKRKRDESGKFAPVRPVHEMGAEVCDRLRPIVDAECSFEDKVESIVASSLLHSKEVHLNTSAPAPTKPHQGTFS